MSKGLQEGREGVMQIPGERAFQAGEKACVKVLRWGCGWGVCSSAEKPESLEQRDPRAEE